MHHGSLLTSCGLVSNIMRSGISVRFLTELTRWNYANIFPLMITWFWFIYEKWPEKTFIMTLLYIEPLFNMWEIFPIILCYFTAFYFILVTWSCFLQFIQWNINFCVHYNQISPQSTTTVQSHIISWFWWCYFWVIPSPPSHERSLSLIGKANW